MTPESQWIELDWLKRWSMYSPDSTALKCGEEGEELSYAQLFARARRLAMGLKNFGIAKGDRVAAVAQNGLDYIALFFAVQRLGAILVPVNHRLARPEVQHILKDSGAKLVAVEDEYTSLVEGFACWSFADLKGCARSGPLTDLAFGAEFEDPAMILYTSGTTGFPKGAVVSHRMIYWNSINTGLRLNLTQDDVVLTFLPLFHTGGWNVLTTPCLHRGARVVVLKKFDAARVLSLVESERVTVLFGVPTTMDFLARAKTFAATDLSSVRYAIVGGEPLPLPLIDIWEARGVPVRQGYGLTEFGPNVFSLSEKDSRRKAGSIGYPNFYIEARVLNKCGLEASANEVGELVLRGPVAMSGYWGQSQATAEAFQDGWLRTGDLVRRDDEGYFYVVGRKKEMFISGGENVYPAEVEKVLRAHPGVREAAVIGVPHAKWGECGKAFVSFEEGEGISAKDLHEFCLSQLAKFKVPTEYVILKDLPKTASGKIAKSRLPETGPLACGGDFPTPPKSTPREA